MTLHEWLRLAVIICTAVFSVCAGILLIKWHQEKGGIDLRDLFMTTGRDKKPHMSRIALAEVVALGATTSGYLGVLAAKPELYVESTAVYGGLWAVRGGFSTWIKNRK